MSRMPQVSFEVFPPAPKAEERFWTTVSRLSALQPAYLSVTYGAGGSARDRSDRVLRRMRQQRGTVPAAHLTTVGASRAETDDLAKSWIEAGISHFVALRGDMPEMGDAFTPHPEGYAGAAELTEALKRLGAGHVSVGAYPEPHPDYRGGESDLVHLRCKFAAGADDAITQYVFEPEIFLRYRDRVTAAGIDAPVIAGIMPVFDFAKVSNFSRRCGASVPAWLEARFAPLADQPDAHHEAAVETAVSFCRRLQGEGVEGFHIYTLNRPELTIDICRDLGWASPAKLREAAA
ncbi:methylenetetrahydrofolate reductase [Algihabitans albus]|uniref:methylenetetrahydrofolate reductase n=1 Tax=Algihabitans albus TaxID=2164067 RepID=UPI000E5D5547|nr:methylenetetrahydrofolate reductase [Algihabitans albus]